jgi:predicted RNA binding protein YcfA (HicA-like mRNA interferase family)
MGARKLSTLGFHFVWHAAGSHDIGQNPTTGALATIPNHPGDMPEGTLRAILKQAGVRINYFLAA